MATEAYQQDSLGWRVQQLQQQLGEWWEWQLRSLNFEWPGVNSPDFEGWTVFWEIIKSISLILLVLLVVWALWRIWQLIYPSLVRISGQFEAKVNQSVERNLSITDWLKRSQSFQQQGNYYQACYCIYMAMLQQLDEKGLIPQQNSRTDQEYRYLVSNLPTPTSYETLLDIHQQMCFGYQEASPELLEECQQAYQDIIHISA